MLGLAWLGPGSSCIISLWFCRTEDSDIRCEQLNMLQDWLADFRKSTSSSSAANPEELVAFDVVCGDFNFDNCSSGEACSSPLGSATRGGVGSSRSWKDRGQAAQVTSCSSRAWRWDIWQDYDFSAPENS